MNCREMQERIALHVSGDLDFREERFVEDHLAACESCARLATGLRADLEAMRVLRAESADEGALAVVRLSVLETIESQRAQTLSPLAWIITSSNLRWAAAAVAILLVVIAGLRYAEDAATSGRKTESAGIIGVPAESSLPAFKSTSKEPGAGQPKLAPIRATAPRLAITAKAQRNAIETEKPQTVPEDPAIAKRIEIIDSNANSDPLSPAATLVKLKSSDPDVVLYWLVESNGG